MLDEMLLGDPSRRFLFGMTLLGLAGGTLLWIDWRVRRAGDSYLSHRGALAFGVSLAPVGVGILFSAAWGLFGVLVFLAAAVAVCGAAVVAMFLRGTS